jgi:hypothetical protein
VLSDVLADISVPERDWGEDNQGVMMTVLFMLPVLTAYPKNNPNPTARWVFFVLI